MMLNELSALLAICGTNSDRSEFLAAIIEDNALGKSTVSTRKLSAQRLSELYGLDRSIPLFRMLERLWSVDPQGQSLTALLVALARDPLLKATASSVLQLRDNDPFDRESMKLDISKVVSSRLNESTLDKVVRNAASSWTQSGHLEGRTIKKRRVVRPTTGPVVMALLLGYLQGFRGLGILRSFWCQALDAQPSDIARIASTASMTGLIQFRHAGDVIDISFPNFFTSTEEELLNEQN